MNRRVFVAVIALGLAAAVGYYAGRSQPATGASAGAATARVYQCPMHPWIKSDHPGKCTICAMDLVAAGSEGAADPNLVTLTPASAAVIGLRTVAVQRSALSRTLRIAGVIEDDDTRHRILAARVPGRVEKLFINYVGAEVTTDAPLATIYSPEMLGAQRTYVERLRAGTTAFTASERATARERLLELGLTAEEITILEHTLEPTAMVTVRSPMTGTVVSRAAYEGQYVQTNDRLFEIGDFSSMWFVFDAHEADLPWLHVGQQVEVSTPSQPDRVLTAPIAFIDPNLDPQTRTVHVRVILANPDRLLLHQQTAFGRVRAEQPDTLVVPRSAVLRHSGTAVVYVEQGDRTYLARQIQLGRIGDDAAEVRAGLAAGDRVVAEGALVLDGQAQLAHAAISGDHDFGSPAGPDVHDATPPVPDAATLDLLGQLARTAADGSAALAADDLVAYRRILPALRIALAACLAPSGNVRDALEKFRNLLPDHDDLKSMRLDFEPFSTALADVARTYHLPQREKLQIFQCPMSPVLGTGRWLQRATEPRNPFFGSAMPACGDPVD